MDASADNPKERQPLVETRYGSVRFAFTPDGVCPAFAFWNDLSAGAKTKFYTLFQRICNDPQLKLSNRQQFKLVVGKTFAFKRNDEQARIFCFRSGNCWYLTLGFAEKKEDDLPPRIVSQATQLTEEALRFLATKTPKKGW